MTMLAFSPIQAPEFAPLPARPERPLTMFTSPTCAQVAPRPAGECPSCGAAPGQRHTMECPRGVGSQ